MQCLSFINLFAFVVVQVVVPSQCQYQPNPQLSITETLKDHPAHSHTWCCDGASKMQIPTCTSSCGRSLMEFVTSREVVAGLPWLRSRRFRYWTIENSSLRPCLEHSTVLKLDCVSLLFTASGGDIYVRSHGNRHLSR